ncbi:MAG: hypothetical protein OIF55_16885 [Amphritea sp.]|nr:hypothetical protein [Amphritea sp.]
MATAKDNEAKSEESKKVAVVFEKRWNRYFPKDIAGFDKETADDLVKAKIAKLHK